MTGKSNMQEWKARIVEKANMKHKDAEQKYKTKMRTNMEGETWKAKRMRKEKKRDNEMERKKKFFFLKTGKIRPIKLPYLGHVIQEAVRKRKFR